MGSNEYPQLVIIGGAEDKLGPSVVLRAFVDLAGGASATIVVIPAASEVPDSGRLYADLFVRLGAGSAQVLELATRETAQSLQAQKLIETANAVFFTGGDQLRLMSLIGGTHLDTIIHRRSARDLVVGGTSAGAAAMSGTMIVDGDTSRVQSATVSTGPGLELVPGVLVDQHFTQRGRISRLLSVIAQFPHYLGVGIDEDTALLVRGHQAEVIGSGSVTIIDAGTASLNDALEVGPASCITLCHVTLHCLAAGRKFDLLEREPIFISSNTTPP
jgi:cyanophycinase